MKKREQSLRNRGKIPVVSFQKRKIILQVREGILKCIAGQNEDENRLKSVRKPKEKKK